MLADDYAGDALNVNGPIIRDLTEIIQYRTIENQSTNPACDVLRFYLSRAGNLL
ncbi:hypothetical protein NFY79_005355 [Escherichia coli]|uniref:hypothetical protein n=1 Tax=Escherichia coli TaxID=562 RepID=UPI0012FFCBFC|nr:hypothetical protein [Escherichia coli]EFA4180565.1 hypothetical protein [Escherichia coli O43:H14]EFA9346029.1 hypothetical protein [Escherichia coli]EFL9637412.1 hypothetical protein [Escherichia coli]EFM6524659.1 hypothetical protein [Escherichia coli]EIV9095110.1 hypothetical protein [Escherichia coli]